MLDKLEAVASRFEELCAKSEQPDFYSDPKTAAALLREKNDLEPIVETFQAYRKAQQEMKDAQELMGEPEKDAWRGLVEKYCRRAYGAGWVEMLDYWMYLVEKQRESGDESGAYVAAFHMWTRSDFERMKTWLSAAEDKAAGAEEKARVRVAAYAVDQLGRFLDYTAAFSTGTSLKKIENMPPQCGTCNATPRSRAVFSSASAIAFPRASSAA